MRTTRTSGDILISVLIFAAIAITVIIGLVNWGAALLREIRTVATREQAFQIAEAGVDYYRWHLAQVPNDYQDGTGHAGPYYHNFYDKNNNLIGSYSLTITPPPLGSTKVTILATATTTGNTTVVKSLQVTLAQPSLAQFAVVANDNIRFGAGTSVYGPVTANGGIHFDGTAYNIIASAKNTYTDPDTGLTEWGVWSAVGNADPQPPSAIVSNPSVFTAGRQFPVPAADFAGLTLNLQQLQTAAAPGGACAAPGCWLSSGSQGYHMVLRTDGKYDMYKVTALQATPNNCTNTNNQAQWGTWSIKVTSWNPNPPTEAHMSQNLLGTYAYPANGIIFVEDNLWIDGTVKGNRLTIASGVFPDPGVGLEPNITVNDNLLYTYTDGTDVVGLIAQGNLNVGLISPDNLTIDAALVSENGRIGRYYYGNNCTVNGTNYYTRAILTLDGMIASALRYGFAYTDGTGYATRNITYDGNLLYSPPPSFPLASTQYQTISWKQIQ